MRVFCTSVQSGLLAGSVKLHKHFAADWRKRNVKKGTGSESITRAIAIDSKSRSWMRDCAIFDLGLLFLLTSLSVSKLFLPAFPKLVWVVSSVRAFPYQLRDATIGLHDVHRFHHDVAVDEFGRHLRHHRRHTHHIRLLMEDSSCLSASLVVHKTKLFAQFVFCPN